MTLDLPQTKLRWAILTTKVVLNCLWKGLSCEWTTKLCRMRNPDIPKSTYQFYTQSEGQLTTTIENLSPTPYVFTVQFHEYLSSVSASIKCNTIIFWYHFIIRNIYLLFFVKKCNYLRPICSNNRDSFPREFTQSCLPIYFFRMGFSSAEKLLWTVSDPSG